MNEAEKICSEIQKTLPNIKPGTLRFWGMWFGKPYDNDRKVVACGLDGNVLRLRFQQDEQLTIWAPTGLELDSSELRINDAERVLWEWFYYGRPKTDEYHYFWDFVKASETIVSSTNETRYVPKLKTNHTLPAAEILTLAPQVRVKSS